MFMTLCTVDLWQSCMLYVIRSNPMHPLCGALPKLCVLVLVTRGALVAHRYTSAGPRRTSKLLFTSLCNDLGDPVFDGVGLAKFKSWMMPFVDLGCSLPLCLSPFSLSLLSFAGKVLWVWSLRTARV